MTWDSLLAGIDPIDDLINLFGAIPSQLVDAGVLPYYLQLFLSIIPAMFEFLFYAFASSLFLLLIFFGFWYVIVNPLISKFLRL